MDEVVTTHDAFLNGAVTLVQPANRAHRSGSDAVLLAACLRGVSGPVLDMGAGAGAVGLIIASTSPEADVMLAENDPSLADCCQQSCSVNTALKDRVSFLKVDLLAPEADRVNAGLERAFFDHVVSNPPYRKAGHVRTNPDKRSAHVITHDDLDGWMRTAASVLKPGGSLTLIFAADGLMELMDTLKGRFGATTILPLHPRDGAPAERILVRAIKGRKTPVRILPGLVLHQADGGYTAETRLVMSGSSGIDLGF